jgi:hypothetical protein
MIKQGTKALSPLRPFHIELAALLLLTAVLGLGWSAVAGATVPICIDDGLCIVIDPDTLNPAHFKANRYWVKKADFNSDGYVDLYVTGKDDRAVGDFILYQQPQFKYTVGMPDTNQRAQANTAALTPIIVHRKDLTADGVFDFELQYVSEAIPDSPDIIVLTQKDVGTPRLAIARDARFESLVTSIETVLANLEQLSWEYVRQHCSVTVLYIPPISAYNVWDVVPMPGRIPGAAFAQGEWDWMNEAQSWRYAPTVLSQCTNGAYLFSPEGAELMQAVTRFQGGVASEARAAQVANNIIRKVAVQSAQRQIARAILLRNAAIAASAALIADDASVIGVIDDIGLVVTVAMIGYAVYNEYNYNRYVENNIADDFGIDPEPQEQPDPYEVKSDCKPWDAQVLANQRSAVLGRPSPKTAASWRLRKNLERAGCGCPPGYNINGAHHIIEKGDMSTDAQAARACLRSAGIDVDWAGNGICLPTNDNAPTKAFRHWDLHGANYNAQMRALCEEALREGGAQGVRDMLDEVRRLLSRGEKFW